MAIQWEKYYIPIALECANLRIQVQSSRDGDFQEEKRDSPSSSYIKCLNPVFSKKKTDPFLSSNIKPGSFLILPMHV
jgi:hypothetical protein